jgi:hypothetical protein
MPPIITLDDLITIILRKLTEAAEKSLGEFGRITTSSCATKGLFTGQIPSPPASPNRESPDRYGSACSSPRITRWNVNLEVWLKVLFTRTI